MCLAVYMASPLPLPLIAWDDHPAFYVEEVPHDDLVRAHFSHPNVYYLGAHEGCGCGFAHGLLPLKTEDDRKNDDAGRASVAALKSYVGAAASSAPAELYACWEGEQGLPVQARLNATVDMLGGGDSFEFV